MKKLISLTTVSLFLVMISTQGCSKKSETEQSPDCKTCKAFATADKAETTEQVCSEQAEQNFRSSHSGQEISCR